jgi:hypothetical protein
LKRKSSLEVVIFLFKPNTTANADVWKNFSLIYEKQADGQAINEVEFKYYCICKR